VASNTNKRVAVKYVRDRAKSAYVKQNTCHICGTSEDLELHHTHSLTLLLNKWAEENHKDISTDESVIAIRDEFIELHYSEIYEEVYTLCNKHHVMLHGVYGKAPSLTSASKQVGWIEKQKAKLLGISPVVKGSFSDFY